MLSPLACVFTKYMFSRKNSYHEVDTRDVGLYYIIALQLSSADYGRISRLSDLVQVRERQQEAAGY